MSRILMAALALSAALATPALVTPALADGYKIVDRFKMPDGGWDYASSDPAKGRIYWARNEGFTDIIDMKTGKLSQLKNTGNGHLAVPVRRDHAGGAAAARSRQDHPHPRHRDRQDRGRRAGRGDAGRSDL